MLKFLMSISIGSGAFFVALASAIFAAAWGHIRSELIRTILALMLPVLISYSLYWAPVWLGRDSSEYSAWALVCIIPWSVAGVIASIIIERLITSRRKRKAGSSAI